jgi:hypothetical protein
MIKKSSNFLERHLEKLVLAGVGIVCIWLGLTRVVISPNKVQFNRKELAPAQIDSYTYMLALNLEQKLGEDPEPTDPPEPKYDAFAALVEGNMEADRPYNELFPTVAKLYPTAGNYAISDIVPALILPNPSINVEQTVEDREYSLPLVAKAYDPLASHVRGVVYMPTAMVDQDNHYTGKNSEPNDLDFVTVQAKFNVFELYKSFYESFASDDVPEEWRDPCLAVPVFSAVQLDRQELRADGSWSGWQVVPRTHIDLRRDMFDLREAGELPPGGIKVRLLQFRGWEMARHLLQPEAYRIASAEEEWFPPSLRPKYLEAQRKEEARERRELMDKKEREREKERPRHGRDRGPYRGRGIGSYESRDSRASAEDRAHRGRSVGFGAPGRTESSSTGRKESAKHDYEDAMGELFAELDKLLITEKTDLSVMTEPLVFWAHDDTVEPGKTYRYRVRLGLFNPVAGMNKISEQNEPRKNEVILWSAFSSPTDPLDIPERLYFFPLREAGKVVTVQVSRYQFGYWYNWNFPVQQGEVIGTVVQNKETNGETTTLSKDVTLPKSIDYSTGAVLVDVATVNGWSGFGGHSLNPRYCSDMLYSFDGATIEHLPVGYGNWPKGLQIKFNEIKKLVEKVKKPWRSWTDRRGQRSRYTRRTDEGILSREDEEGRDRRDDEEEEAYRRMMERRGGR